MKLSDFLIRGRHLFGFLVPGIMWVASFFYLSDKSLFDFVESGNTWIKVIVLLGLSYILGFILQTITFPLIADTIKWLSRKINNSKLNLSKHSRGDEIPSAGRRFLNWLLVEKDHDELDKQLEEILKAELPVKVKKLAFQSDDIPGFCKYYILEFSDEMRRKVMEKENDINLMVASMIPVPLLFFSIMKDSLIGWRIWLAIISVLIFWIVLAFRLKHYVNGEKEEWRKIFLLLQMYKDENNAEVKKEAE